MAQKFLCVYHDMIPTLEKLQPAEVGRLILAALKYDAAGEQPASLPGKEDLIWPMIMAQIDRANASYESKCETNRRNALKRYDRMPSDATACDGNQYNKNTIQQEEKKNTTKAKADAFAEFAGDNEDLLKALREFSSMRSKIKKPLTPAAQTRLLSKLKKDFSPGEWVAVLNQSVDHCWQDLYPLKTAAPAAQKKPKQYTTAEEYHSRETNINMSQLDKIKNLIGG